MELDDATGMPILTCDRCKNQFLSWDEVYEESEVLCPKCWEKEIKQKKMDEARRE